MVLNNKLISGWGRNVFKNCKTVDFEDIAQIKNFKKLKKIARGNGRSYGDSSIKPDCTVEMRAKNRLLYFDVKKGIVIAESGMINNDLLKIIVKSGWFLPVTPGTKFVSVGGMVASNVHGKNHHLDGGISNFVESFRIYCKTGKIKECSRQKNKELFYMTIGGMGLTGIILSVKLKLLKIETSFIRQKKEITNNLKETMSIFSNCKDQYCVAWLNFSGSKDKIGSSVVFIGNHIKKKDLKIHERNAKLIYPSKISYSLPFKFRFSLINYYTTILFNHMYFFLQKFTLKKIVDIDTFFYPLDKIRNWNLVYGNKGFIQYQFVIPIRNSYSGLIEIMNVLRSNKVYPMLPVLKLFEREDIGVLSFPLRGYSLAMDFPDTKKIRQLLLNIDKIVIKNKGRVYLTKDSRITKKNFNEMYKDKIRKFKKSTHYDPKVFASAQSNRLF